MRAVLKHYGYTWIKLPISPISLIINKSDVPFSKWLYCFAFQRYKDSCSAGVMRQVREDVTNKIAVEM